MNHDDLNYGSSYNLRGNANQFQQWTGSANYLSTSLTYDTTGQKTSLTDPLVIQCNVSHADHFYTDNGQSPPASYTPSQPTNAFLTAINLPLIGSANYSYYYGTGQTATATDQNNQSTYFHFLDGFNRSTLTSFPDGGWILQQYPSPTEVDLYQGIATSSPSPGCTAGSHNRLSLDNFGRITTKTVVNDPSGAVVVTTAYDLDSRTSAVSTPYRTTGDATYGINTTIMTQSIVFRVFRARMEARRVDTTVRVLRKGARPNMFIFDLWSRLPDPVHRRSA